MGLCFSCCSTNDTRLDVNGDGQLSPGERHHHHHHHQQHIQLDEYSIPVKFKLGQTYQAGNVKTSSRRPSSPYDDNPNGILIKVAVPWSSPIPLTREQMRQMRNEFWETAPAYGGSEMVWLAIREAVELGSNDIAMAQSILSAAGVTTPTGFLTKAYDELGYQYIIPPYCLADPSNGLLNIEESDDKETEEPINYGILNNEDLPRKSVKVRLSDGTDLLLNVPDAPEICIGHLRRLVFLKLKLNPDTTQVRFFFSGHGPIASNTKLSAIPYGQHRINLLQAFISKNNMLDNKG